jgi:hypothetical protein
VAWEYSDNEYIKLFRKLINWEWYSEPATKDVFLHCLLKANWKPTSWKGIALERGEFIQSIYNMAKETGLSVRQIRTALSHLIDTNSVTIRKVGKYRIINVSRYVDYQSSDTKSAPKLTHKRHTNDTKTTQDIRSKEHIRSKEDNILPSATVPTAPEEEEEDDGMTPEEAKAAWEKWKEEHQKNESIDISVQE